MAYDRAEAFVDCNAATAPEQRVPFRPIQYLGNKLRALEQIGAAVSAHTSNGAHIVDLFSGTTVVAQRLALAGYSTTAVDVQRYSVEFATALLGIDRKGNEQCSPNTIASECLKRLRSPQFSEWVDLATREQKMIATNDHRALSQLAADAPLIWRSPNSPHYARIASQERRQAFGDLPLLTAIYGGSYFGFSQALTLDLLRQSVESLKDAGDLSSWQYSAAMTSILSAASAAAHSAGKHFAQPLNAGRQQNTSFLIKRTLEDRRVCIGSRFRQALAEINGRAKPGGLHSAVRGSAEEFVVAPPRAVDLYYVDPPYTAQQYSRFYHVLETMCSYDYPELLEQGKPTTGLYPAARYKSAFSSKKADRAFDHILQHAAKQRAVVLISYSQSSESSTGNARMISLSRLLETCRQHYGTARVFCDQMNHRYRQFNSASLSNRHRDDPEILITCKPR